MLNPVQSFKANDRSQSSSLHARLQERFRKSGSHLKIPSARMLTWSKFHTEDPQILGTTVARCHARPGLRHTCVKVTDHVSIPYKRTGGIYFCNLFFTLWVRKRKNRTIWI